MRTILTIQELLKGRNAEFDKVAKQKDKVQMTCLPLNTVQGKNGVDFSPYPVSYVSELLESHGKKGFKEFVSTWNDNSDRCIWRAERMIKADFIVFFLAYDHKSGDSKKAARFIGVYEVLDHNTNNKDKQGNYLLKIKEVKDFKTFYKKVIIDFGSSQEMTQDFATKKKPVI